MGIALDDLVAGEETWELEGKTYRLGKLDFADQAEITKRILSKRGDPMKAASRLLAICEPGERKDILARAYDDETRIKQVTPNEYDDFTHSVEGYVLTAWLALRKHHPDITEEEAGRLIEAKARETLALITIELQKVVADATPEQIAEAVVAAEDGVFGEIVAGLLGLPAGNSQSPAKRPGTIGQSTGNGSGSDPLPSNTDTATQPSAE